MAHSPGTIKADILIRVHGGEAVNVATIELPIKYAVTPGHAGPVLDYSPIADAGRAIAQTLTGHA